MSTATDDTFTGNLGAGVYVENPAGGRVPAATRFAYFTYEELTGPRPFPTLNPGLLTPSPTVVRGTGADSTGSAALFGSASGLCRRLELAVSRGAPPRP